MVAAGRLTQRVGGYAGSGARVQCLVALPPLGKIRAAGLGRGKSAASPGLAKPLRTPWVTGGLSRAARISAVARPFRQDWVPMAKARVVGGNADCLGPGKKVGPGSLQKRTLEVELEIGAGTVAPGKEAAQVFHRLEQRIGLRAGRRRPLTAEHRAHRRQARAHPLQQVIEGLQPKGQRQHLGRRLNGTALQPTLQQGPQSGGPHRVARQHVRQENAKTPSAAAAPAPAGAPDPLPALGLAVGGAQVVAVELAVPVECLGSPASWTAELLEQKRCSINSFRSPMKRRSDFAIASACLNPSRRSSFF